ncbi:MAG: phosphoribosylanthranilate isomerase [Planctomycetes bacterium]|nr:phosphoribosylanthranilate isomerase [Planctomycetota bacterium]
MFITKVKICGITNYDDAAAAFDMGADILGFNFYPQSPRYIEPKKAFEIIAKMPGFLDTCGIFVNAEPNDIHEVTNTGFLNWVQFHGDESPAYCEQFRMWTLRSIKAVRVQSAESIHIAEQYHTSALLFDAFNPKLYGGTGETFDWSLVKNCPSRIFLAGGITPDNVLHAIDCHTYAIDICSGIESEPGKKDHQKMKQLFEKIRNHTGLKAKA